VIPQKRETNEVSPTIFPDYFTWREFLNHCPERDNPGRAWQTSAVEEIELGFKK
jgi:hypothetical protein